MNAASGADLSDHQRLTGLIAAIATISVAAMGFGHSMPLFSLLMKSYGASDTLIGMNSALSAVAIIATAPFYAEMITKAGLKLFIFGCLALMIIPYWGIYLAGEQLWIWFPMRLLFGMGASGLFAASEIWINMVAKPEERGRVLGLYGTALALGFAIGPFAVMATGIHGAAPFLAGIGLFAAAALPVSLAVAPAMFQQESKWSFFPLLLIAPATFWASGIFAVAESSILTFLPVSIVENGFGEARAAQVITVYAVGAVAFQYLIGRLSDKTGKIKMLLWCTGLALIGSIILPFLMDKLIPLYLLLFLWGGVITGISTLGLVVLGDRFPDGQLAAANTGYVFMYGVGSLIGPAITGPARDIYSTAGLPAMLILAFCCYLLLLIIRRRAKTP